MKRILVIGANPAWEKVLEFNDFQAGEVNRATRVSGYAAGKATNFCRALKCLGALPGHQLTLLDGETGRQFIQDIENQGLICNFIADGQNLRTCTNCVCKGTMTELVEPGAPITSALLDQFLALLRAQLPEAVGIAVAGSIPDGSTPHFLPAIAQIARDAALPLLLDNYREALAALGVKPDLFLKINALELRKLSGQPTIAAGLAWFQARYPHATAAITDGANPAWLLQNGKTIPLPVPAVEVVNPLGAGDTCSAVFFARMLEGKSAHEAFADGLAAASASCLTNLAGEFSLQTARRLRLLNRI